MFYFVSKRCQCHDKAISNKLHTEFIQETFLPQIEVGQTLNIQIHNLILIRILKYINYKDQILRSKRDKSKKITFSNSRNKLPTVISAQNFYSSFLPQLSIILADFYVYFIVYIRDVVSGCAWYCVDSQCTGRNFLMKHLS